MFYDRYTVLISRGTCKLSAIGRGHTDEQNGEPGLQPVSHRFMHNIKLTHWRLTTYFNTVQMVLLSLAGSRWSACARVHPHWSQMCGNLELRRGRSLHWLQPHILKVRWHFTNFPRFLRHTYCYNITSQWIGCACVYWEWQATGATTWMPAWN